MKKIFVYGLVLMASCSLFACGKTDLPEATVAPSETISPTETAVSEISTVEATEVSEQVTSNDEGSSDDNVTLATEIPVNFQSQGWISEDDAITLLKMFLGSYDSEGNEFSFGHEATINIDGTYYYNFRISTLVSTDSGTSHQSYYANYIVSTDGNDILEYTVDLQD